MPGELIKSLLLELEHADMSYLFCSKERDSIVGGSDKTVLIFLGYFGEPRLTENRIFGHILDISIKCYRNITRMVNPKNPAKPL